MVLTGLDEHDGWLRVETQFLPMTLKRRDPPHDEQLTLHVYDPNDPTAVVPAAQPEPPAPAKSMFAPPAAAKPVLSITTTEMEISGSGEAESAERKDSKDQKPQPTPDQEA